MSINLVPGFNANIEIKSNEKLLYEKIFSNENEFKTFMHQYGQSKKGWSILEGVKDSSKGIFFPTLSHFAQKVGHTALKIIASIAAVILDIVTLPIRLYDLKFGNKIAEARHPLLDLIGENEDIVDLTYELSKMEIFSENVQGNPIPWANHTIISGTKQIALKNLPGFKKPTSDEMTKEYTCTKAGGEWFQTESKKYPSLTFA